MTDIEYYLLCIETAAADVRARITEKNHEELNQRLSKGTSDFVGSLSDIHEMLELAMSELDNIYAKKVKKSGAGE